MDSATPAAARLREILDALSASPSLEARHRVLIDEAKAILSPHASPTITIRHDPRTMSEPAIVSMRIGRAGR